MDFISGWLFPVSSVRSLTLLTISCDLVLILCVLFKTWMKLCDHKDLKRSHLEQLSYILPVCIFLRVNLAFLFDKADGRTLQTSFRTCLTALFVPWTPSLLSALWNPDTVKQIVKWCLSTFSLAQTKSIFPTVLWAPVLLLGTINKKPTCINVVFL